MSQRGDLTRQEAVERVGEQAVAAVEAENAYPTSRVLPYGDTDVEWRADHICTDLAGDEVCISIYWYFSEDEMAAVDEADQLDWTIKGDAYEICYV